MSQERSSRGLSRTSPLLSASLTLALAWTGCSAPARPTPPPGMPPDREEALIELRSQWHAKKETVTLPPANWGCEPTELSMWYWTMRQEDIELILQDRAEWRAWALAWQAQYDQEHPEGGSREGGD